MFAIYFNVQFFSFFQPSVFSAQPVEEVYPYDPPVYHYNYSVDDDYTGAKIYADEARDEHATHGMYEVRNMFYGFWIWHDLG